MRMALLLGLLLAMAMSQPCGDLVRLLYPDYFPSPVYPFSDNPLRTPGVLLGRTLFYDPLLSLDNTISCASCHAPYNAFAHTDHALSHGIGDSVGLRNAPALINLAWQPAFMWDGAIHHLDMQALAPIESPTEMGEDIGQVVQKLAATPYYPALFQDAFGDTAITGERLLKALAQFQLTLVSANSAYDRMRQGTYTFTHQENRGYTLVKQHCASCHPEPLFSHYGYSSNGLPMDTLLQDAGRYRMTGISSDSLLFKVPTLRNLKYSYPYMHDGRFKNLRQVLDHYSSGVQPSAALKKNLPLTPEEKADILAFLRTLNDSSFVFNPDFQFPKSLLPE